MQRKHVISRAGQLTRSNDFPSGCDGLPHPLHLPPHMAPQSENPRNTSPKSQKSGQDQIKDVAIKPPYYYCREEGFKNIVCSFTAEAFKWWIKTQQRRTDVHENNR